MKRHLWLIPVAFVCYVDFWMYEAALTSDAVGLWMMENAIIATVLAAALYLKFNKV